MASELRALVAKWRNEAEDCATGNAIDKRCGACLEDCADDLEAALAALVKEGGE